MKATRWIWLFVLIAAAWLTSSEPAHAWGKTGHRAIGEIAEAHLTPWAAAQVRAILGTESLARASTWPDEIRSDSSWDHSHTWHYINFEDGETLDTVKRHPKGDVLVAMERFAAVLADDSASHGDQVVALRFLTHFVGDIHQPMHAGRASDRGGNDIAVSFHRLPSNLHAVWDSGMIDKEQLSFTELVRFIHHPTRQEVAKWQNSTFRDWVEESLALRQQCYDFGEQDGAAGELPRLGFEYSYQHTPLVHRRLVQAGVRLAGVLNGIFEAPAGHEPLP